MTVDRHAADGLCIAAALAGEGQAFAVLVERYQGPLYRAAISRLGKPELAEEAVQEALWSAHRWLATYDSRYSFRTWLWTILLNQCSRLAKREAKHTPLAAVAARDQGDEVLALPDERTCSSCSPLEALLARENESLVHELLARLPEVQADALRLRFFGGLTFPEIAAAMGCSEPGAKHRVKTGLVTMSKWMAAGSFESRQREDTGRRDACPTGKVTGDNR